VAVKASLRWGFLSHTLYWMESDRAKATHVAELHAALNLLDA
jgi:hypothetical protein